MKQPVDIIKEILIKSIMEGEGDCATSPSYLIEMILNSEETLYVSFDKNAGDSPVSMYTPILSFTDQYPKFDSECPGVVLNYFGWVSYESCSGIKELDSYDHEDLIFPPDSKETKIVIKMMKAYII